jgi:hypothetical protein
LAVAYKQKIEKIVTMITAPPSVQRSNAGSIAFIYLSFI